VLREYIVSEAMAALAIPTTRSLAAVTTGEPVMRETVLPGAVLTRVHRAIPASAPSSSSPRAAMSRRCACWPITSSPAIPDARREAEPYRALFDRVIARQAELIAKWMLVGFIHAS